MASFAAMGMPRPPMGMGMGMPPMMHPSGYHMGMGMPPMMTTSTGQSGGTQTVPTPAPAPAAVQPATFNDPNNDVKNWSEHEGDDGRTYWHNRATKVSSHSFTLYWSVSQSVIIMFYVDRCRKVPTISPSA